MKLALRSYVRAGVVLFGASMIAVSPLVASSSVSGLGASTGKQGGLDNGTSIESVVGLLDAGSRAVAMEVNAPVVPNAVQAVDISMPEAIVDGPPADDGIDTLASETTSSQAVGDDPVYCAAIGCRPGEPGYPLGESDPIYCAAIGCRPGEPGYPLGGSLPGDEPIYCLAIGCRPGEPGYPLGGSLPGDEPVYCAAIGCRPGEPGYPLGGTPAEEEAIHCAAIGCRPGEPGYPLGGSEPDELTLVGIAVPSGHATRDDSDDATDVRRARDSADLSDGNRGADTGDGNGDGANTGADPAGDSTPAA